MSIRWKSRLVALATLALGLFVGALAGALVGESTHADAQPAAIVEPERTCYVDFVKVLKEDSVLLNQQIEDFQFARKRHRELQEKFSRQLKIKQDQIKPEKPNTAKYAQLMDDMIKLNADYTNERYEIDLDMQKDLNDRAKERYKKLKDYAVEIARRRGATQILVIATEPSEKMDFTDLQKALMLSPVLYYTQGFDITAELKERAERDKNNQECDEAFMLDAAGAKLAKLPVDKDKNPDRIDYEIELGKKYTLGAEFSDIIDKQTGKRGPVKDVLPHWELRGEGEIKFPLPGGGAEYTAPAQWPEGAPKTAPLVIEIEVAPDKARKMSKVLRLRIPAPPKDK